MAAHRPPGGGWGRSQFTADHSQGILGPGPQLRQGAGGGHAQPLPVSLPLPGAGACTLGPPSLIQNHQCRPFRVSGKGTLQDRVALGQGGVAASWGQAAGGTTVFSESQQGSLVLPGFHWTVAECAALPGNLESLKCVPVGFQFGCSFHLPGNETHLCTSPGAKLPKKQWCGPGCWRHRRGSWILGSWPQPARRSHGPGVADASPASGPSARTHRPKVLPHLPNKPGRTAPAATHTLF